jgi:16S rRNA processing protein RimM
VRIGFVRRPHGLSGALEVEPLSDDSERFVSGLLLQARGAAYTVASARRLGSAQMVMLEGVDTIAQAEELRGAYLEVPAEAARPLPEGSFYHWQLIGLRVLDPGGHELGILRDVLTYPANDVYVVGQGDSEILVPALASVVVEVDLDRGRLIVEMPEEVEVR